jgi:eukaryotic-like serine/threonine-protein kinase
MGVVLEARHLRLEQSVAVKLLRPQVRSMPEVMARFEREGRAVARLQSSHVARVLDIDVLDDGSPFMVMELLRGRELGNELIVRKTLPIREVVGYMLQACAGMAEAHRMGIVHRDLKPSNLFLVEHEGQRTVKVLDFGISKLAGDINTSVTTTASAFGTPLYMSPEQVRSVKNVDHRADIWSLGVVLYEMLTGAPPFNYDSATAILAAIIADKPVLVQKLRPDIPAGLAAVVMRSLEKDPSARFADVGEFAAALAPHGPTREDQGQSPAVTELLDAHAGSATTLYSSAGRDGFRASIPGRMSRLGLIAGVVVTVSGLALAAVLFLYGREASSGPVAPIPEVLPSAAPVAPRVEPAPVPEPSVEPPRPPITPTAAPGPLVTPKVKAPASAAPVSKPPPRPPGDDPKYL